MHRRIVVQPLDERQQILLRRMAATSTNLILMAVPVGLLSSAVLAVAMVGAGISLRNANGSQQPFVDAMLAKYPYWRELVQKVSY